MSVTKGTFNAARFKNLGGILAAAGLIPKLNLADIYNDLRFVVVNSTHDLAATGTQDITVTGITPKAVLFLFFVDSSTTYSVGVDDGVIASCMVWSGGTMGAAGNTRSLQITIDGSNYCHGRVASFSANTIRLNWTKVGSPTGTGQIYLLAFA